MGGWVGGCCLRFFCRKKLKAWRFMGFDWVRSDFMNFDK